MIFFVFYTYLCLGMLGMCATLILLGEDLFDRDEYTTDEVHALLALSFVGGFAWSPYALVRHGVPGLARWIWTTIPTIARGVRALRRRS